MIFRNLFKLIINIISLVAYSHVSASTTAPIIPIVEYPITYSKHVYFLGSSTISGMNSALSKWKTSYNLKTINYAKSGELIDSMCIRIGALPAFAKFKESELQAHTKYYFEQDWPFDISMKPFTVNINGVEGEIGVDSKGYYLTPKASLSLKSNIFYPLSVKIQFEKNAIFVVNLGKNNLLKNERIKHYKADYVIKKTNECLHWIQQNVTNRIVVVGHYTSQTPSKTVLNRIDTTNRVLAKLYPNNYFDFRKYIEGKNIWIETNIQPNEIDLKAQSNGFLAPSLAADNLHLNSKAALSSTEQIYQFIKNKNWIKSCPTI